MIKPGEKIFWGLLLIWTILNFFQAGLTELDPDEAYYWMYAKDLDWGYFDHPPFVALLIKVGTSVFPGELGVRFLMVMLQSWSFYLLWILLGKPLEKTKILTLFALLVSMPFLEVYGFVTTPDSPLLFFTVLFFYCYQRFLTKPDWAISLLWGACFAALLYSKYHGVLLIFFTLLSNLKLLRNLKFWVASIFGFLLFFPHLYWQYLHDFPSFRYHLSGRDDPYELKHTITYIVNQLLVFNPFLFPMLIKSAWKQDKNDALIRAFYSVMIGFWAFFLWATFKGHVEPQWTAIITIPLIIMGYRYAILNPAFDWWLKRLALFSIGLFVLARVALIKNIFNIKSNFHRTAWIYELQDLAQGYPVVFVDSYREASKYAFYSKENAYTFTDVDYRKNQFDIWDWEQQLHNQRVFVAGQRVWECTQCDSTMLTTKTYKTKWIDSLQIVQKVALSSDLNTAQVLKQNTPIPFKLEIENPYHHVIDLNRGNMPITFQAVFYREMAYDTSIQILVDIPAGQLPANTVRKYNASLTIPSSLTGTYDFALGVQIGDMLPSLNSQVESIAIKE